MSWRDASSCDVTRAVGMWEAIYHWILWRRFTLLSHSAYVTWSHVPARLSHFCCRTHFVRWAHVTWAHVTWAHVMLRVQWGFPLNSMAQIHTSVTLLTSRDITCHHASRISVVARISWGELTSHDLTWREDSVSPALQLHTIFLTVVLLHNSLIVRRPDSNW